MIWKDIKEYVGYYQVSDTGKVRRVGRVIGKGGNSTQKEIFWKGRVRRQSTSRGYHMIELCKNGKRKQHLVHRLVAIAFIPNHKRCRTVNHKNFDRKDNRVENLEWCTHSQNCMHAVVNGRKPDNKGEKHGGAKLKNKQVIEIKSLFKKHGYKKGDYKYYAFKYKVSEQCIYDIHKGRRWTWLSREEV